MEDIDIINKFFEKTEAKVIEWRRCFKSSNDPKLGVYYKCDFVPGEYVEIAPARYTDATTFLVRYSYRLSFFDSQKFCYKSILPKKQDSCYEALENLFNLIEKNIANLDEKLTTFFEDK